MLFENNSKMEDAIRFSRFDADSLLSTVSRHPFQLEEAVWPTAEHYYQAHKFEGMAYAQTIITAASGQLAHKAGNRWFKRKISGWKDKRRLWMTRALYRKVSEYPEVKTTLLETEDNLIVETSMYDHYWGLGRDQRGQNMLGKVWMDIRNKIREQKE